MTSVTVSHETLCDLNELKALISREKGRMLSQDEVLALLLREVLDEYRKRRRQQRE